MHAVGLRSRGWVSQMQTVYAMAELRLPPVLKHFSGQGQFWTAAHFLSDTQSDWSLLVYFDKPVTAGETVVVPVTPLIFEAEKLLVPGAEFDLFLGAAGKTHGRIISAEIVSKEELSRIFQMHNDHV